MEHNTINIIITDGRRPLLDIGFLRCSHSADSHNLHHIVGISSLHCPLGNLDTSYEARSKQPRFSTLHVEILSEGTADSTTDLFLEVELT